MQYELVINSTPAQVVLALLKEKKLIEIHQEDDDSSFNVGDVYLGKIRKIVPSLNAAFVDVGYEKDAFLHYHDLGPRFKSMNKYVQNTLVGKQTTSKLGYNKIEPLIDKNIDLKFSEDKHISHYRLAIDMFDNNKLFGVGFKNFTSLIPLFFTKSKNQKIVSLHSIFNFFEIFYN